MQMSDGALGWVAGRLVQWRWWFLFSLSCGVSGWVLGVSTGSSTVDLGSPQSDLRSKNLNGVLHDPSSLGRLSARKKNDNGIEQKSARSSAEEQYEQALDSYRACRMAPEAFRSFLGALGANANASLAERILSSEELAKSSPNAVEAFVAAWAKSDPLSSIELFRNLYGGDLDSARGELVEAFFSGLAEAQGDDFLSIRSTVASRFQPIVVGSWAVERMRKEGFLVALSALQEPRFDDDAYVRTGSIPFLVDTVMNSGELPARVAADSILELGYEASRFFPSLYALNYPQDALEWVTNMPESHPARPNAINAVLNRVGMSNPDAALDFAQNFRGTDAERNGVLVGLRGAFASRGETDWVEQVDALIQDAHIPGL